MVTLPEESGEVPFTELTAPVPSTPRGIPRFITGLLDVPVMVKVGVALEAKALIVPAVKLGEIPFVPFVPSVGFVKSTV